MNLVCCLISKLKLQVHSFVYRFHVCVSECKPPWSATHVWGRIKTLLRNFVTVKISHCYKQTNQAADYLAKIQPKEDFVYLDNGEFSPNFREILAADKAGTVYIRV